MKIDMSGLTARKQLAFEHDFEFFAKWLEATLECDNCYYFDDLQALSTSEYFQLMKLLYNFNLVIEEVD